MARTNKALAEAIREDSSADKAPRSIMIHIDMSALADAIRELAGKKDEFQKVEGLTPHVSGT